MPPFLVASLGDARARAGALAEELARSRDGRLLATSVGDRVVLLDADTLDVVRWCETPPRLSIARIAFTADDTRLVVGGWNDHLAVIDVATGAGVARLPLGRRHAISLAASPTDPDLVVTGGFEHHARVWNLRDLSLTWEVPCWEGPHALPDADYLHDVSLSPDGRLLLTVSYHGADLWDLAARRHLHRLAGYEFCVAGAAFSPDGRAVYLASNTGALARADVATGALTPLGAIASDGRSVHRPAVTPDGERLLSCGEDGRLHLTRLADGSSLARVQLSRQPQRVALHRDGRSALVLDGTGCITRVSTADASFEGELPGGLVGQVFSLAWRADGRALLALCNYRDLVLCPLDAPPRRLHRGEAVGPMSADGRFVVVNDNGPAVYATKPWARTSPYDLSAQGWHRVLLPDGAAVMASARRVLLESVGVTVPVPSMANPQGLWASPDGARVFVVHRGTKLVVIDTEQPSVRAERAVPRYAQAIALDRRRLALGLNGARLVLLDAETADKGLTVRLSKDPEIGAIVSLAASPGGALVAVGFSTGQVALVDAATGAVRAWFTAASGGVGSAAFSPDGSRLATAGEDHLVRVWDVAAATAAAGPAKKPKGRRAN